MITREPGKMEIMVAPYGWQGAEWESYYPEDLPVEWRLDYLANEFFTVVVPYEEWAGEGDAKLLAWLQQVSQEFRFYWELPPDAEQAAVRLKRLRANETIAAHWGGVIAPIAVADNATTSFSPAGDGPALWRLECNLALRPLRQALEAAIAQGGKSLLIMVAPSAAASLRPVRDITELLEGG